MWIRIIGMVIRKENRDGPRGGSVRLGLRTVGRREGHHAGLQLVERAVAAGGLEAAAELGLEPAGEMSRTGVVSGVMVAQWSSYGSFVDLPRRVWGRCISRCPRMSCISRYI